jgi:hypothetical protein
VKEAGVAEVWAARAWNVFNEGKPFSIVYPLLVLVVAAPLGLATWGALPGALAMAVVLSFFPFPLRGRALLWLVFAVSIPLLEPWRAPGLIGGALAGYVFFTVFVWGTIYYHLRTGAPWSNWTRFWRLVATNSDPTSGNALEQVPKFVMALSAGTMGAAGGGWRVAGVALLAAVAGALAWRLFAKRLPDYPAVPAPRAPRPATSKRVYVIVVDGLNRRRLWQAHAPVIDRLFREGTEYLDVDPAYPARTVVCFSSMLTGATPAEHGMRSNFVARLGVRTDSVFAALERAGMKGRLVGIAHLLDPFGEDVVRSVTSVQPTGRLDHSLTAAAREVVEREDPELGVFQLLAADQLGHVRGVRNPDYTEQIEATDRRVGELLDFLRERGKLDGATVILMADHGQSRGIGGHGHLDWGERPVPFAVWGEGAVPGAVSREPHSVLELAQTVCALLGVEPPAGARGRELVPERDDGVGHVAPRTYTVVGVTDPPAEVCGMRHGGDDADVTVHTDDAEHLPALLDPIARGRADRVLGIRPRRSLADRLRSSLDGARMGGAVLFDSRTPHRACVRGPEGADPVEVPLYLAAGRRDRPSSLEANSASRPTAMAAASTNG